MRHDASEFWLAVFVSFIIYGWVAGWIGGRIDKHYEKIRQEKEDE